ncbi:alpha-mannosidase [Lactobacillus plantarum] [Lactiplantibacillus mudanjiangensis]|uniref:glycoside hydrolase family 38 N-terminal domain-containing protein n=1 Tax=Lactiplantibacillus mudanjiangensis TaxID=1296538 RepID=UPI001015B4E7|nr:alpha-mannosidase [Lactobacillus plantarum] [Lactiplantibacillus mudanjiangensis]
MKPNKIHIVPHMHWDREWYFSTEESQVLLVNNMDEIMDMLEQHPDYPAYVLDGQTAILEDYFAAKPENVDRVKKLVQAGRLKVGPWYTQTDEAIIGAESITRNLLYGMKDSHQLGDPMMIGYVPDSFGQSAQAPMILNQFGIQRSLFWRGFSNRKGTESSEFKWQSDDGSEVLTANFPLGYAAGKYLENDAEKLKARMDKLLTALDARANGQDELIPNGHDQMPIQRNIKEVIGLLNKLYPERQFTLSTYEQFFDAIQQQSNLPVVNGEMLDGKNGRIHRSIYSVRMDLKAYNARIESKLTNILEPLATLAYRCGIPYQHGLIELIWKELMKNHAHDSIGGCVSDKVNREILGRYLIAEERTDMLIDFYKRKITMAVKANGPQDKLTLFNLLPNRESQYAQATIVTKAAGFQIHNAQNQSVSFHVIKREKVDAGLIDRQIVAHGNYEPFNRFTIELNWSQRQLGYETFTIDPIQQALPVATKLAKTIDTDAYYITFNDNGTMTIFDKKSQQTYERVLDVENQADDGDEYDFSPLRGDQPIYSADLIKDADIQVEERPLSYVATISYTLILPTDLKNRLKKTNVAHAAMIVKFTLTIAKASRTIQVVAKINNQVKDQRTRVLIPTNIIATESVADNQFGMIKRPVHDPMLKVWQRDHWDERPDEIYPFLTNVSLSDQQTVSVFTNSSREYEVVNETMIALTMFRSVDWLGKSDLVRRPGRPSGIHAATPDGEMIGSLTLDFGIRINPESLADADVAKMAKEYLSPVESYNQIPFEAMHLNPVATTLPQQYEVSVPVPLSAVVSVIKVSEDDSKMLLRCFNATDKAILLPEQVSQLNLAEKVIDGQKMLKPNQVSTLVIEG